MNYAQRALLLISTALLLGLLAGCGQSQVQLGWIESNQPGHFRASYAMFSGSEVRRARAGAGETLVLQYDAKVDKGALAIRVEDPDNWSSGMYLFKRTPGRPWNSF